MTEDKPVRGRRDPQVTMLAFVDLEARIPADHPLRTIKTVADQALAQLSTEFDAMYAEAGRPSIPPERLLKASLLIALYSVRSERAFCEVRPEPAGPEASRGDLWVDENGGWVPPDSLPGAGPDWPGGIPGSHGLQPDPDGEAAA